MKSEFILIRKGSQKIENSKSNVIEMSELERIMENLNNSYIKVKQCKGVSNKGEVIFNDVILKYTIVSYENEVSIKFFLEEYIARNYIEAFEKVNESINSDNSKLTQEYYIVTAYDPVSEYYINNLKPIFSEFERKLRLLFWKIYIRVFSYNYYENLISKKDLDSLKEKNILYRNSHKNKKIQVLVNNFFQEITFSDIEKILFTKKWLCHEEIALEKLLDKYNIEENYSKDEFNNIDEESYYIYQANLEKLKQNLKYELSPKTDWERYFLNKVKIVEPKVVFDKVRKYRNIIAHNKSISTIEYNDIYKFLKELLIKIDEAIILVEDNDDCDIFERNIDDLLITFEEYIEHQIDNYLDPDIDFMRGR